MTAEKRTFVYLLQDDIEATLKALTESYQRAQERMDQAPELSDEWVKWQGERAKSLNALQIFQGLEMRRMGAWTLTFELGREGINKAHRTMTGQDLDDPNEVHYRDELLGLNRDSGEWDNYQ